MAVAYAVSSEMPGNQTNGKKQYVPLRENKYVTGNTTECVITTKLIFITTFSFILISKIVNIFIGLIN